jgi:hypothetical protein
MQRFYRISLPKNLQGRIRKVFVGSEEGKIRE